MAWQRNDWFLLCWKWGVWWSKLSKQHRQHMAILKFFPSLSFFVYSFRDCLNFWSSSANQFVVQLLSHVLIRLIKTFHRPVKFSIEPISQQNGGQPYFRSSFKRCMFYLNHLLAHTHTYIFNYSELRLVHLFFRRILHVYIALEILKENICHHRHCLA